MWEIELFDHLTMCIYKMYLQIIFYIYIYVKTGFGIKLPTMVDMPENQTKLKGYPDILCYPEKI